MSTTTSSRVESKTAQKTVNKPGQHRHLTRFLSRKLPQHTDTASERAKSSEPLLATAQPYSFTTLCAPPSHHVCERTCVCIAFGTLLQPPCFSTLARALSLLASLSSPTLFCSPFANRFAFFFSIVFSSSFTFFSAQKKPLHSAKCGSCQKFAKKYINTHYHTTTAEGLEGGSLPMISDLLIPASWTTHTLGGGNHTHSL